ncbi:MAG: Dabb family protein [Phycisphaerae bacterium]|nr:Dabb family protein [Tepidisphaeraceae bacterium]
MRTTLLALAALTLCMLTPNTQAADAPTKGKTLYHLVFFKFKPDAPKERIDAVGKAILELKGKIPSIQSVSWGTNVSPEKKDKGYTHAIVMTFKDEKGRDEYLPHPDHKAFGGTLKGIIDDVLVFDVWSE